MNQQRFAPTTTTNLYKIYIYKEKFSFVFSRENSSPQFLAAEEKEKKKSLVSEDSWKIDFKGNDLGTYPCNLTLNAG